MSPRRNLSLCLFLVLMTALFLSPVSFAQEAAPTVQAPPAEEPAPPAAQPAPTEEPQEVEPPNPEHVISLSICDVVARAVSSNLDIAVARYVPDISDAAVLSAKGEFDPIARMDYRYSDSKMPQTSREGLATGAGTTETHLNDVTLSLDGKLISGTTYKLQFDREFSQFIRHDVFDPATGNFTTVRDPWQYVLDTYVNVTQPLAKNFGLDTNLAAIRITRVQRDISIEDFRQNVINIINNAQTAYWNLVLALENLRVAQEQLTLSEDLLRENRIRLKVGIIAPLDVVEAETGVARSEESVILARRLVKDAEDNLKRLLNLPKDVEEWNITIVPADKPVITEKEFNVDDQIELALRTRPDYKASLMQIESDTINEQFNRNQMLPTVDVVGQYEFQAVNTDFSDAFDSIENGDSPTWLAGLTAEYPIGNHTARGNYESTRLQTQQSKVISDNLRLSIIVDVRQAIRAIESSLKSIEASQKTVYFARRSLEAENKKLEVGISTSHDVLQFVEQLVDAERREVIARVNYRQSLVNLAASTGILLEKNNVIIDENL